MKVAGLFVTALLLSISVPAGTAGSCFSPGGRSSAAWSPSGALLAVSLTSDICPTWQIGVLDGSRFRALGMPNRAPQTLSWAPDERQLVSGDISLVDDVVVYDVAAGHGTTVGRGRNPSWSPDGDAIAFTDEQGSIHLVAPDGTEDRRVATGDDAEWSPDSAELAYARGGTVFVADPDGSGERAVGRGETARWSPDGTSIATLREGRTWLLSLDVAGERQLGPGTVVGWSEDGDEVALLSGSGAVRLVAVESGLAHRVGEDADGAAVPSGWDRVATILRVRGGADVFVASITGARPRLVRRRPCAGSDCKVGTDGPDRILGRSARDEIYAGAGDDRILARGGHDRIEGEYGRDFVDAGPGNDVVYTHGNDDRILGGAGIDFLTPGDGEDYVDGGGARDVITVSGDGRVDQVRCGPGKDVVYADPVDRVARDCETVRRAP